MSKVWTEEEKEFVKNNASNMTRRELSEKLNRTYEAVKIFTCKNNIKCKRIYLSNDVFVQRCIEHDIIPIDEYINCKTSIKFFCLNCNKEFYTRPNIIFDSKSSGCGCTHIKGRQGGIYVSGTYFAALRIRAKTSNIEFSITCDYIDKLLIEQKFKCKLSGIPIYITYPNRYFKQSDTTASLDRIDSSKGYIEENVQWVHKDVNRMKMDLNQDKFINYCKLIAGVYND